MPKISNMTELTAAQVAALDLLNVVDATAGSKKMKAAALALGLNILAYFTDTGGDDAYVVTTGLTLTALTAGMTFAVKVATANTGACTLNVDSIGAVAIKVAAAAGLADPNTNEIAADAIVHLQYDGTIFQLLNPATR